VMLTILMSFLASRYLPSLNLAAFATISYALYRYIYIRCVIYLVTTQYIRITQGIFFKRTDTVELYRVKDYIITEPIHFQIFRLMDLQLKTTDPENPILWLRGIPQTDLIDILRDRIQQSRQTNHIIEIS